MGVGVVADLVAFADDALHDADVLSGLGADEHEGAFDVFLFEDVEDFRGPLGVGAVVEGDGDFVGVIAVLLDGVRAGIDVHVLIDDELLAGIGFVAIEFDGALAGLGQAGDADDVAVALVVHIVAGLDGAESLEGLGGGGLVPDIPEGAVFLAQAPESECGEAEAAGGAQFVKEGDAIEEPDDVALVQVLVDVLEVGIESVVIEVQVGVGVGGALPYVGDVQIFGVEDAGLGMLFVFWVGNGEGPVVAVIGDGADELFLGNDLEDTGEVADEPLLAGDGTGIAGGLVLVVVHQDDAVGVGGNPGEVGVGGGDRSIDIEAEVARVQIGVELLDEGEVGLGGVVGEAFKVERKAAIDRICGEKANNLLAERGALGGVLEDGA